MLIAVVSLSEGRSWTAATTRSAAVAIFRIRSSQATSQEKAVRALQGARFDIRARRDLASARRTGAASATFLAACRGSEIHVGGNGKRSNGAFGSASASRGRSPTCFCRTLPNLEFFVVNRQPA